MHKVCLKWNDFQESVLSSFGSLSKNTEFSDVTLVCEDGQQVKAHKVVLASTCPFFKNFLKNNPHPQTLIYMRGVKSADLIAIIDFLYQGEANVYQENLDSFLSLAEELKLEGMMGLAPESQTSETITEKETEFSQNEEEQDLIFTELDSPPTEKVEQTETEILWTSPQPPPPPPHFSDMEDFTVISVNTDNEENPESADEVSVENIKHEEVFMAGSLPVVATLDNLDEIIRSMTENVKGSKCVGSKKMCKVCGKVDLGGHMREHIESNHITGVTHDCKLCGNVLRTRNSLRKHMFRLHKNTRSDISFLNAFDNK